MSKSVKITAFAKANLSLNITGKTQSGLHVLDSVMMSVDCFDAVTVTERADDKITVAFEGAQIDCVNNTAYKAAALVRDKIGCGVDITVQKGIPIGAGLGGSSADGAAVLRALDLFYRLPERGVDMRSLALSVGSDVPFMLTGGLARVRGVGDELFFIENKLNLFIAGIMCGEVSTAKAYAEFDKLYPSGVYCPTDNDALCGLLLGGDSSAISLVGNALYRPACSILSGLENTVVELNNSGARACMTGSGGMVLGYFDDMQKFLHCVARHKSRHGFKALAPARTGLLHAWISRE